MQTRSCRATFHARKATHRSSSRRADQDTRLPRAEPAQISRVIGTNSEIWLAASLAGRGTNFMQVGRLDVIGLGRNALATGKTERAKQCYSK